MRPDSVMASALFFWASDLILIVIVCCLAVSSVLTKKKRRKHLGSIWFLGLPLLLWIAAGAVSIAPSIDKTAAIIELIRMLRICLIFVAVFLLVDKLEDFRVICICLVLAFSLQSILVLFEYLLGHPVIRLPGGERVVEVIGATIRPGGTMGHSSNFAKFAALSLPCCLAITLAVKNNIWRVCAGLILICGFVALMLTLARIGLATSLLGLGWIFFLLIKKLKNRRIIIPVSLSFLLIGICLSWFLAGDRLMDRSKNDGGSASIRPLMFSVAWNVIKDNPLLGTGLNNYTLIAPDYDNTREAISITLPVPVHNIYLLHAAEMGIPGAICFIWFLSIVVLKSFENSSYAQNFFDSAILKAIGVGISCSWLQGLTGMGARPSIVHTSYLAVIAGALAALSHYNQNRQMLKKINA